LSDNLVSCKKVIGICNMSDVILEMVLKTLKNRSLSPNLLSVMSNYY